MAGFKKVFGQGSSPALAASKTIMLDQEDLHLFVFPKDSDSLATQHFKNINLDISFETLSSTTQSSLLSSSPFQHTLSPSCSSPQKSTHTSSSKLHSITEKRAQQNRKAQRAFRERKEKYISGLEGKLKELECKLDDFVGLKVQFEDTRIENEKLRCENEKLKATLLKTSNDHQLRQPLPISVLQTPTISPTPSATRTLNRTPERDCCSEGPILMNTEELFSQSSVLSYMSPQFQDQLIFQEGDFLESVNDSSKSDIKFVIPDSSFYNCLQRMYN